MEKKPERTRIDRSGIRIIERNGAKGARRARVVTAALVVVAAGGMSMLFKSPSPEAPAARQAAATPPGEEAQGASDGASSPPQVSRRVREVRAVPAVPGDRAAPAVVEETVEAMAKRAENETRALETLVQDMLQAAVAAGETRGIAVFPPPGTDPIKVGLVVPKDYDLPEGYVRHYQLTDDGRRLEPILMFSPDYAFVDAQGQPLALPEDGIVPEEMAPEGLPLRNLQMPKNPYGTASR